ncbi:MAG: Lrp/AsnC ligand binding domain-containing protein [Desulfurococcales archaeon]|nr:Lrp/AsnC ligand binding domain-containing protein [Desulfurococcales archaeon]NOZ31320.1 Lrp/AsnC family transcriptional regulator [Thermoproteota archaeon]MCE4618361.1 Lrp/AsnC ligand binding domain-containing protein [Desulfurococcales archaeon]MCE4622318.1 Lrp/AsnC ligand binding domain-containing protein [Desulfurococcales archaeon]MCE4626514.1 Lrp/AsnC ligand binding domain-containing protein [Desulfurococcales archaeon]
MALAIVMINVEVGKENEIFEKLFELPEVKEVYMVYGVHDVIAVIEADTMDSLRTLITEKIRRMDGVKSSMTSIVVMHKKKE